MELGRIDIGYMKNVTNSLLSKVVNVPNERGGYRGFQLFKECEVSQDDQGEWYVEINAHDRALPLMFEFKSRYFTYQLWNALRLRSSNQLRMYEILKQYETIGQRILTVEDLKSLLGISNDEYPRFGDFKKYVLNACQKALTEHTDIKFTCEPHGKKGRGGKIHSLKFIIEKNEDYVDKITLEMFLEEQKIEAVVDYDDFDDDIEGRESRYDQRISFLGEACCDEFSREEIIVLFNKMRECEPHIIMDDLRCYHYLNDRYNEMLMRNDKSTIKSTTVDWN